MQTPLGHLVSDHTAARRQITAIFCDIVGSTQLVTGLDPEAVHGILLDYYSIVSRVVADYGGSVEKFIGDGAVAVFGLEEASPDDAARALFAAIDIRDAVADHAWPDSLPNGVRVRLGVSAGQVLSVSGQLGMAPLSGEVVTLAARLQAQAPVGGILASDEAFRMARSRVVGSRFNSPVNLGRDVAPISAWHIEGRASVTSSLSQAGEPSEFVGRSAELDRLIKRLRGVARDGTAGLVSVCGGTGVGKTRLAAEFARRAGLARRIGWASCRPLPAESVYAPLLAALDSCLEAGHASVASRSADGPGARTARQSLSPTEIGWRLRVTLEKEISAPTLLVFDDYELCPDETKVVVEILTSDSPPYPLLVLTVERADIEDRQPRDGTALESGESCVVVGPLSDADCRRLITTALDVVAHDATIEMVDRVAELSGGNPLIAEQAAALCLDRGIAADGELRLPGSVHAVVAERLARLPAELYDYLEWLAVLEEAEPEMLDELVGRMVGIPAGHALAELRARRLVADEIRTSLDPALAITAGASARTTDSASDARSSVVYSLASPLIKASIDARVPKAVRAKRHVEAARVAARSSNASRRAVAAHLLAASELLAAVMAKEQIRRCINAAAAHHLTSVGRMALEEGAFADAAGLYKRAVSMARNDPALVPLSVRWDLFDLLVMAGRHEDAVRELAAIRALGTEPGRQHLKYLADLELESLHLGRAPNSASVVGMLARAAAGHSLSAEDRIGWARAVLRRAQAALVAGDFAVALSLLDTVASEVGADGPSGSASLQLLPLFGAISLAAVNGSEPVPAAIARCETLLAALKPESRESFLGLSVKLPLAVLWAMDGRTAEALALISPMEELARRMGVAEINSAVLLFRAAVHDLEEDWPAAVGSYRSASAVGRESGTESRAAQIGLVRALFCVGRETEAIARYAKLRRQIEPSGGVEGAALQALGARAAAARGLYKAARHIARSALDRLGSSQSLGREISIGLDLAEALHAADDPAGCEHAARIALRLARSKGDQKSMERAARLVLLVTGVGTLEGILADPNRFGPAISVPLTVGDRAVESKEGTT